MSPALIKLRNGAIVYALGIACPEVPNFIWAALVDAILGGNISLADIQKFLSDHSVKEYYADNDFPHGRNNGDGS